MPLGRALDSGRTARELHDDDPAAFAALALLAPGAYYLHPRVRRLIGYPGQKPEPAPDDESDYWLRDGLLDPVIARGPDLARRVTATRETFAGMGDVEKALWYLAALISTAASRTARGACCDAGGAGAAPPRGRGRAPRCGSC